MKVKTFHIRLTKENLDSDEQKVNDFMESVTVKQTESQLISGQTNFWSILIFYTDRNSEKHIKSSKLYVEDESELSEEETKIYETLKHWRYDKASQLEIPSYMICHNTELMTVAKEKPQTPDELYKIRGGGDLKIEKFGEEIIAVLNSI